MKLERVTADREDFLEYLEADPVRNAFAIYDLKEEAERVACYAVSREASFLGYLLQWYGATTPSVILSGNHEATGLLLEAAPKGRCTMLVNPALRSQVEENMQVTGRFPMDVLVVDRDTARLPVVTGVRRLSAEDAPSLADLYAEMGRASSRDYRSWIRRGITYGVFEGGRLVSVAGTHMKSDNHCMIGGVYTARDRREKGYGTAVTTAVTREALGHVPAVSLMVVSFNEAAIKLYEKLGYRKALAWDWLDVGTGRTPLL